ncbi:hypothetical protein AB0G49_14275 [Streptomyces longwoodensis]|uniref:hypothetical protein n=1 Tax=Streptomyces longwoodensis TaxID=68231 RepID=UPI0033F7F85C
MVNIPGGADITVGTDRSPTAYAPGGYVPRPVPIDAVLGDAERVRELLRALSVTQLRALAALAITEADARDG